MAALSHAKASHKLFQEGDQASSGVRRSEQIPSWPKMPLFVFRAVTHGRRVIDPDLDPRGNQRIHDVADVRLVPVGVADEDKRRGIAIQKIPFSNVLIACSVP
jgi:hypothetical protein